MSSSSQDRWSRLALQNRTGATFPNPVYNIDLHEPVVGLYDVPFFQVESGCMASGDGQHSPSFRMCSWSKLCHPESLRGQLLLDLAKRNPVLEGRYVEIVIVEALQGSSNTIACSVASNLRVLGDLPLLALASRHLDPVLSQMHVVLHVIPRLPGGLVSSVSFPEDLEPRHSVDPDVVGHGLGVVYIRIATLDGPVGMLVFFEFVHLDYVFSLLDDAAL